MTSDFNKYDNSHSYMFISCIEFDHLVFGSSIGGGSVGECGRLSQPSFGRTVIQLYLLSLYFGLFIVLIQARTYAQNA